MSVKLYSFWESSCAWRVRVALALKGVEYEYEAIPLTETGVDQNAVYYRNLNPMNQVPALSVDGQVLIQSMAIVEFLDEKFSDKGIKLFPDDLKQKTKVREICEIINSGIQPIQSLSDSNQLDEDKRKEWGRYWIDTGFVALDRFLEGTAGKYCVGDTLTAADAFLVPQVGNAHRFGVDMSKFPLIARIDENLKPLDAFIIAHPKNQPDCPQETGCF